jgi:hypothetical protein
MSQDSRYTKIKEQLASVQKLFSESAVNRALNAKPTGSFEEVIEWLETRHSEIQLTEEERFENFF